VGSSAAGIAGNLADENFYVRYEAAHFLSMQREEHVAKYGQTLADMMQHDANRLVRHEAAKAVMGMGQANKEKYLNAFSAALQDSEVLVRRDAAKALSEMGPAAKPCCSGLAQLLNDEYWPVRMWAARAMVHFREDAVPHANTLMRMAVKDEEITVREASAQVLGALGDQAAVVVKALGDRLVSCDNEEEVVNIEEALVIALGDPDLRARKQAMKGLDTLIMRAKENVSNTLNNSALAAETKAKEHHDVEMMDEHLVNEDWIKRRAAVHSLRSHARGEAANTSQRYVTDDN
jgi:HEAT repeat protein